MPSSRLPARRALASVSKLAPQRLVYRRLFDGIGISSREAAPSVSIATSFPPTASNEPTSGPISAITSPRRRGDLDRRLVGHHGRQDLVFDDLVADHDVPFDDLGFGNAFADVRQLDDTNAHFTLPIT